MPRKKTTPNETEIPAEAIAAVSPPEKRIRKPQSEAAEPTKKATPRKRAQAAGGESAVKPDGNRQPQTRLRDKLPVSKVDVSTPPPAGILDKAVSEHEQIALLAYEFWQARGCQGGSPEEDWIRAEQEFRKRQKSQHIRR